MLRCDSHVHFFTQSDLDSVKDALPYVLPAPHSLKTYLDTLIDGGQCPSLINNVHLSILPDSENVYRSFEALAKLQAEFPERYGDIQLIGTIKADPAYATAERLSHPQVKGVRVVLHDTPAEAFSDDAYSTSAWQELYANLRDDQHVHVYAKSPASNLKVLKQIPDAIAVAIDHLGSCDARSVKGEAYQSLLEEAAQRGNVFFKGPGYRTAIEAVAVEPFVEAIIRVVGADKLFLESTDAPHVGADDEGRAYADHFTAQKTFAFTHDLALNVAKRMQIDAELILNKNIKTLLKIAEIGA